MTINRPASLDATELDNNDPRVDRLIAEMKNVFGEDRRRIDHALAVLGFAQTILAAEGGDPLIVKAAAILHDIGIQASRAKNTALRRADFRKSKVRR